ncbi:MAG: septal ring lytic transglycosylase RlpA family protein [Rudaea sp.]
MWPVATALLAALPLLLAGCAHAPSTRRAAPTTGVATPPAPRGDPRYAQEHDSGPGGPPPDVSKIAEPVPKAESASVYGNKSPYTVLGQSYRVLPTASGYVERGIASWYGNKFHGYTTSNFEKYDMYAYTAAHKTLPLPSYARVTNLDNGASVVVRINDRGPFAENRIIDLSYVAALKLGIWQKGTGVVEVRAIDPAHPNAAPPSLRAAASPPARGAPAPPPRAASLIVAAATPEKAHKPALYLQVGAFSDHGNAERAAETLRKARIGEVSIIDSQIGGHAIARVRLGPLRDADEVDRLTPRVRALGLGEPHAAIDD